MTTNESFMKDFAKRLQTLLATKGWNMSELARHSGVPKATIHHWTCGKVPGLVQARKVAGSLKVPFHEFLFGEPDPHHLGAATVNAVAGTYLVQVKKIEE